MDDKGNPLAAEKQPEHHQLPRYLSSPVRRPVLSTRHSLFRRLVACALVVGFFHILYLRFFPKYSVDFYEFHTNGAQHYWPIAAFTPSHEILNGKRAEEIFLEVPNTDSAIQASRLYAHLSHRAGTKQDFRTAEYVLEHFDDSFGIDSDGERPVFPAGSPESRSATLDIGKTTEPRAWIDVYYPVLSTPGKRSLEILDENGTIVWTADVEEIGDPLDEDATKSLPEAPVFHGLSKDGNVTGGLVYAGFCRPEDFDEVEKSGVNITGKITMCRYGGQFRGLKVKASQERGAVGCLVYSDTQDDGSVTVENGYEAYPVGPARNPSSVQRGSVQFLSIYPGDPTTPGYPSYENSTRTNGTNIPDIPSLPISWANFQRIMQETSKNDTKRTVRLVNEANHEVTPIWNTMAVIPGYIKDEVVMIGNHRDAWVLGATDPTSGTVSVHEVVRGFGELYKRGWKPLRTILLASWDAEEYGLIGSTEWAEDFPEWIQANVVTYINLDSSVSGSRLSLGGSPSLAHLLKGVAQDLPHPTDKGRSLWDARDDSGPFTGNKSSEFGADVQVDFADQGLGIHPLGSGSDYTAFLQRLGVASSDGGFGNSPSDAVYHYHSIYDSERAQEVYLDPGFHRHVAVAKYVGLTALRLADSIVLPLNTTSYSLELSNYIDTVAAIIPSKTQASFDLSPLRQSVEKVYKASLTLDKEKAHAEKHLWDLIRRWKRRHDRRRPHPPHCPDRPDQDLDEEYSYWTRFTAFISSALGQQDEQPPAPPCPPRYPHPHPHPPPPPHHPHHPWPPHRPHRPWPPHRPHRGHCDRRFRCKLIKAVKRIRAVNGKLANYEAGFISKEGLIDREWYKHLGVAPGKWLGYGATTFPGLTEAFTIEHNTTLAKHEMDRLVALLDRLAQDIAA